jgi:hypothetical protein
MVEISHDDDAELENEIELSGHQNGFLEEENNGLKKERLFERSHMNFFSF